jgi:hypothetical protein
MIRRRYDGEELVGNVSRRGVRLPCDSAFVEKAALCPAAPETTETHRMPVLALARSDKSATVAGSVAGPQPGHTAGPKQVGRGRSRNQRPQITAHGLGGCCGSQADNAGSIPVTRSQRPRRRSGALSAYLTRCRLADSLGRRAPIVPLDLRACGLDPGGHGSSDGPLPVPAGVLVDQRRPGAGAAQAPHHGRTVLNTGVRQQPKGGVRSRRLSRFRRPLRLGLRRAVPGDDARKLDLE